jgi:branched-chain amino acid transport system permease protein
VDFLNAITALLNYVVIPAASYGSQLAFGALGVTIIYGILRFSNFAGGETMAWGAMFTLLFTGLFQSLGISIKPLPTAILALPLSIIVTVSLMLITDRAVYRFYRKKKIDTSILVIVSFGIAMIMNGITRIAVGPSSRNFFDGERFIIKARNFKNATGLAEGLSLKVSQGLTIISAIIFVSLLFWFLYKTKTGKSMRAYSDNEDLALLSGINPEKVVSIAWIIATSLLVIGGTLYGLDKGFKPYVYYMLLLPSFAAAILGGLGNPLGAIAGGFVIAFSEITITYAFKKVFVYLLPENLEPTGLVQLISTDYKFVVSYSILILVLLFRPTGIFKGKSVV